MNLGGHPGASSGVQNNGTKGNNFVVTPLGRIAENGHSGLCVDMAAFSRVVDTKQNDQGHEMSVHFSQHSQSSAYKLSELSLCHFLKPKKKVRLTLPTRRNLLRKTKPQVMNRTLKQWILCTRPVPIALIAKCPKCPRRDRDNENVEVR